MGVSSTLLGGGGHFWDENGGDHYHDPNTHTATYRCSEGHHFSVSKKNPCNAIVGMNPKTGMVLCDFNRGVEPEIKELS